MESTFSPGRLKLAVGFLALVIGHGAQLFTIGLICTGVAFFAYVAGALVKAIARGIRGDVRAERRRRRTIDGLRDHYIVCGYGRVGRRVAEGDVLIGVGRPKEIRALEDFFAPGEPVAS